MQLHKQYIAQVKASFPLLGIRERKYIKKLNKDIQQYCDSNNPSSLSELYIKYGLPINVVKEFYDNAEPSLLFSRLKLVSFTKKFFVCVIVLLVLVTSAHVTKSYLDYKEYKSERCAIVIETIREVD